MHIEAAQLVCAIQNLLSGSATPLYSLSLIYLCRSNACTLAPLPRCLSGLELTGAPLLILAEAH